MADTTNTTTTKQKYKIPCLIADSAAFLRNIDLQNLSSNIFTIGDVISEIRDSATRQRLAVLPYDIKFREPSLESLHFVTEFSKKTGDFKSLSAVDLRVIALTYQLEKEYCNVEHVKQEPTRRTQVISKSKVLSDKEIAGFYFENKNVNTQNKSEDGHPEEHMECDDTEVINNKNNFKNEEMSNDKQFVSKEHTISDETLNDKNEDDDDGFEDEDDGGGSDESGDADGWITPGNINKVKKKMGLNDEFLIEDCNINCVCLTTDFAMQNVLIQMGLHVLSVQGMLIRQARNYIKKCFGCYKETHDMERAFCPSCGNKTLMKVAVTITDDGTIQYHYPKRRRNFNIRGTKFSIPAPKGGRHVEGISLVEDQRISHNRLPKRKDNINPLDPDYVTRSSPFSVNDTNSRAFNLGLHVKHKQNPNPNENKKNRKR